MVLITIFGAVTICLFRNSNKENKTDNLNTASAQNKNFVYETANMSECEGLVNQGYYIEYCYAYHAVLQKDYSICQKYVSNKNFLIACETDVVLAIGDVNVCEKLSNRESAVYCYARFAQVNEEPKLCDNLSGNAIEDTVVKKTGGGLYSEKDYCYYYYTEYKDRMRQREGLNFCVNIQDEWLRDQCYSNFALTFSDKSICENIEDQDRKEYCFVLANETPPEY